LNTLDSVMAHMAATLIGNDYSIRPSFCSIQA